MAGLLFLALSLFIHSHKEEKLLVQINLAAYFVQGLGEVLVWISTLSYLMENYPQERCQMICVLESVNGAGLLAGEYLGTFIKTDADIQGAFLLCSLMVFFQMLLCLFCFKEKS